MDSELTGRNVKVTGELRKVAERGLTRIEKIVGKGASAHVIFNSQKHAEVAEVRLNARHQKVVSLAEAPILKDALRTALGKVENQVVRRKESRLENKRQGGTIRSLTPGLTPEEELLPPGHGRSKKAPSANRKTSGLHIVLAPESMAERSMTIEEAVKEAESRDQTVFVFRDLAGDVKVLHCAGDGIVRLTEIS